jgi:hypothetical protein
MSLLLFVAGFLAGFVCCWAIVYAWIASLKQHLVENGFTISDESPGEQRGLA